MQVKPLIRGLEVQIYEIKSFKHLPASPLRIRKQKSQQNQTKASNTEMIFYVKLHYSCVMLVQGLNAPLDMVKHIFLFNCDSRFGFPMIFCIKYGLNRFFPAMFLLARTGQYINFPNGFYFLCCLQGPRDPDVREMVTLLNENVSRYTFWIYI